MTDTRFMDVLNASNKFLVKFAGLFLCEALMRDYVIEELSIYAVLHDQVKFRLSLYDLQQRKESIGSALLAFDSLPRTAR